MSREARADRAVRIRELMQTGEIDEAFDAIEAQTVESWKVTFDPLERDNLWRLSQVIRLLRQNLNSLTSELRLPSETMTAIRRIK